MSRMLRHLRSLAVVLGIVFAVVAVTAPAQAVKPAAPAITIDSVIYQDEGGPAVLYFYRINLGPKSVKGWTCDVDGVPIEWCGDAYQSSRTNTELYIRYWYSELSAGEHTLTLTATLKKGTVSASTTFQNPAP